MIYLQYIYIYVYMIYIYIHDNDIHIVFRYLVRHRHLSYFAVLFRAEKKQALLSGGMVAAVAALHV